MTSTPNTMSCSDALNLNSQIVARNDAVRSKYERDSADYNTFMNKYKRWENCYNRQNCTDEYSILNNKIREIVGNPIPWQNCVDWGTAISNEKHQWCVNDFGEGYIHVGGQGNGPCGPGFGRGLCQRSNEKVSSLFKDYMNNIDIFKIPRPVDNYTSGQPPAPVYENTMQLNCCLQQSTGTAGGSITFDNNTQTCTVSNSASNNAVIPPQQSLPSTSTSTTAVQVEPVKEEQKAPSTDMLTLWNSQSAVAKIIEIAVTVVLVLLILL